MRFTSFLLSFVASSVPNMLFASGDIQGLWCTDGKKSTIVQYEQPGGGAAGGDQLTMDNDTSCLMLKVTESSNTHHTGVGKLLKKATRNADQHPTHKTHINLTLHEDNTSQYETVGLFSYSKYDEHHYYIIANDLFGQRLGQGFITLENGKPAIWNNQVHRWAAHGAQHKSEESRMAVKHYIHVSSSISADFDTEWQKIYDLSKKNVRQQLIKKSK